MLWGVPRDPVVGMGVCAWTFSASQSYPTPPLNEILWDVALWQYTYYSFLLEPYFSKL